MDNKYVSENIALLKDVLVSYCILEGTLIEGLNENESGIPMSPMFINSYDDEDGEYVHLLKSGCDVKSRNTLVFDVVDYVEIDKETFDIISDTMGRNRHVYTSSEKIEEMKSIYDQGKKVLFPLLPGRTDNWIYKKYRSIVAKERMKIFKDVPIVEAIRSDSGSRKHNSYPAGTDSEKLFEGILD
ncbi:MAG: hypothetical protein ABIF08_02450 [Nanoarchaeota archaeon]